MIFSVEKGCFSYNYSKKETLKNITFSVSEGNVLSVLGPNGVGKTTLLRCMMGLLPWTSGATFIDRIDIKNIKESEIWQKIAYVPQAKAVAFSYTLEEMVLMGRSSYIGTFKQPTSEDLKIARESLNTLKIFHLKDKCCNAVSGGELQMALIARALCANPSMLVLDEPESNLDFKNQLIILETIERLAKERGISCIFNTHYPAHALKISDLSLILSRSGKTIFGNTKEVINPKNMQEVFEVEVHINDVNYKDLNYQTVTALSIV